MSQIANSQWLRLFQEHSPALERHLARQLDSREDIAELMHEVYLKAASAKPVEQIDNPRSYLYRIASNLVIDFLRQRGARTRHMDQYAHSLPSQVEQQTPERILDGRQRLQILSQVIEKLPPKCKQAFILRKVENLDAGEIAARMGISRNMVEKHLRTALARCREELEKRNH